MGQAFRFVAVGILCAGLWGLWGLWAEASPSKHTALSAANQENNKGPTAYSSLELQPSLSDHRPAHELSVESARSQLYRAVRTYNAARVAELLASFSSLVNVSLTPDGLSALAVAMTSADIYFNFVPEHIDVLRLLLKAGASFDTKNKVEKDVLAVAWQFFNSLPPSHERSDLPLQILEQAKKQLEGPAASRGCTNLLAD